jgi:hypothetical protein
MNRTSIYANVQAIMNDVKDEQEANEIIDLIEASVDDPMACDLTMLYGTKALYLAAGYTEETLPFLRNLK